MTMPKKDHNNYTCLAEAFCKAMWDNYPYMNIDTAVKFAKKFANEIKKCEGD